MGQGVSIRPRARALGLLDDRMLALGLLDDRMLALGLLDDRQAATGSGHSEAIASLKVLLGRITAEVFSSSTA